MGQRIYWERDAWRSIMRASKLWGRWTNQPLHWGWRVPKRLIHTPAPILLEAQRDLYKLMAEVAATPENAEKFHFIDAARVTWLEEQTDALSKLVEMPKEFILPGDSLAGAALSLARTIIRRAERRVVELFDAHEIINPDLQRYLNRLSSLCFVLELLENKAAGHQTTLAKS